MVPGSLPGMINASLDERKLILKTLSELYAWWEEFSSKHTYPLYCIVMAKETDSEVASLVENHRDELDEMSGKDCCFIYFRDWQKAKVLAPFKYLEHDRWVYPIANLLDVDYDDIPGFLFFEQIDSGKFLIISLKGQSQQEIIHLSRDIFGHIRKHPESKPFTALKKFKQVKNLSIASGRILDTTMSISREVVLELLKSAFAKP